MSEEVAKALTGEVNDMVARLNEEYSEEELKRPLSTRLVHQLIADVVVVAGAKMKDMAARIEALEKHGVKYAGVWQRALSYRKGLVVTSGGSMWTAIRDTKEGEEPGKVRDAWQLSAKGEKA